MTKTVHSPVNERRICRDRNCSWLVYKVSEKIRLTKINTRILSFKTHTSILERLDNFGRSLNNLPRQSLSSNKKFKPNPGWKTQSWSCYYSPAISTAYVSPVYFHILRVFAIWRRQENTRIWSDRKHKITPRMSEEEKLDVSCLKSVKFNTLFLNKH